MGTRSACTKSVRTGLTKTVGHNQDLDYDEYEYEREWEDNDYV